MHAPLISNMHIMYDTIYTHAHSDTQPQTDRCTHTHTHRNAGFESFVICSPTLPKCLRQTLCLFGKSTAISRENSANHALISVCLNALEMNMPFVPGESAHLERAGCAFTCKCVCVSVSVCKWVFTISVCVCVCVCV